jgi:hypothetical protein
MKSTFLDRFKENTKNLTGDLFNLVVGVIVVGVMFVLGVNLVVAGSHLTSEYIEYRENKNYEENILG